MPEPTPARAAHAWTTFTAELATMPDVVARLAEAHTADDDGLCRACGRPGRGTTYVPWPCSLARLAREASARTAPVSAPPAAPSTSRPGNGSAAAVRRA